MKQAFNRYQSIIFLTLIMLLANHAIASETPMTLYKSFEGNIAVATMGNSELTETSGYGNCGNGAATSDTLALPAGATIKAAYLYWYAMTANQTGDNYPFIEISNTSPVTFPNYSGTITATRNLSSTKTVPFYGTWKYSGRFADITHLLTNTHNGNYTVDVQGGASNSACGYTEENVRGWTIIVVYDAPSLTDNKKIYVYDGMKGYLLSGISIPVSGFEVPTSSTAGALTVISIQGDVNIPGEYMNTSHASFPSFPADFANSDHGSALDIDTLTGNFTPGATSITLNTGSVQDLIFTTNIILSIPTVPTVANAFSCDSSHYIAQSSDSVIPSQLNTLDSSSSPFTFNAIGDTSHGHNYNAMGYRTQDDFLYGIKLSSNHLLQVSSDGSVNDLGAITGLPAPAGLNDSYDSGDVFPDGYLYIHQVSSHQEIYKIDVTTSPPSVVQTINLNQSIYLSDFAYNVLDNKVYGIGDLGEKYMIDPSTWTVITIGTNAPPASYGAAYTDSLGNVYIYKNNPGTLFLVDFGLNGTGTGTMTALSTAPNVSFNDGASCRSLSSFKDFSDAPASYGAPSHYLSSRVYLGAGVPDHENAAQPTANADGDNNNGVNDEEGVTSFPPLNAADSSYSLPVTCKGGVVAGWIDVNQNGSFDNNERNSNHPVTCSANTATLQWSSLTGVMVGNTYVRLRTALLQADVDSPTSGTAASGEVEDYPLTISADGCTALSGETNVAISPIAMLKEESGNDTNKLFIATTDHSDQTGNLRAYAIGANELPVSSASWNAASVMATQNQRGSRLFTTVVSNGNSNLVAFRPNLLTNASFQATSPAYPSIIASVVNALMGAISPNSNIALLEKEVDSIPFLKEAAYRDFYQQTIKKRSTATNASIPAQVLTSSDDGFLYAFNQSNGALNWGWMPPSLALQLKQGASSFANQHYMQGNIEQFDLKSGSAGNATFASYIVGSYRNGLGHYVLKLNNDSSLASVVWDIDHKAADPLADTAPNQGQAAYFADANGKRYMAYIITLTSGVSKLYIRSMVDSSVNEEITLGFTATATPFVMPNLLGAAAPTANTLYLGSDQGGIYKAALFESDNLTINTNLSSAFNASATPVASIHPAAQASSAILYLGASVATGGKYYLSAQAEDRLTLLNYDTSNSSWKQAWTTSTAAALTGKWSNANFAPDSFIRALPNDARLTDPAYMIANSIVLPVTEPSATANACYGDAYYYLYQLPSGRNPTSTFFKMSDQSAITAGKIRVGKGDAMRMHLTTSPTIQKLVGLGLAEQDVNNTTGVSESFFIKDPVTAGIRSWKELHSDK